MTHAANPGILDRPRAESSALAPWGFATALATLATSILWSAGIGINWGIWTLCTVVALFAMIRERFGTVGAPTFAACAWGVVLSFGTAVTTDWFHIGLLMLATSVLLAIALATVGRTSLDSLQVGVAFMAPFVAIALVLSGLATESRGTVRGARAPGVVPIVRTALITLPLITALVCLLAEADPLFAAARGALERIISNDFIAKSVFFTVVLGVTLGAFGHVLRNKMRQYVSPHAGDFAAGTMESRVLLAALALVEWVFVASAGVSLMKNPAAIAGSGITYAEYVHRGFAELSISATLIIGAVLATRRSWVASDALARRIAFGAIAGEGAMIGIAFMRVVRYEQAYGFTESRLYAQAYMVLLACMSALVMIEVARRAPSSRFAYHSTSAALLIFALCVYGNTDAWIVRHNVDRYARTGKLDTYYLSAVLSSDATPELIASLPRLKHAEHAEVTKRLCESNDGARRHDERWFEWNLRAAQAKRARLDWFRESQPNCSPPS
jgi:hypothetical protein